MIDRPLSLFFSLLVPSSLTPHAYLHTHSTDYPLGHPTNTHPSHTHTPHPRMLRLLLLTVELVLVGMVWWTTGQIVRGNGFGGDPKWSESFDRYLLQSTGPGVRQQASLLSSSVMDGLLAIWWVLVAVYWLPDVGRLIQHYYHYHAGSLHQLPQRLRRLRLRLPRLPWMMTNTNTTTRRNTTRRRSSGSSTSKDGDQQDHHDYTTATAAELDPSGKNFKVKKAGAGGAKYTTATTTTSTNTTRSRNKGKPPSRFWTLVFLLSVWTKVGDGCHGGGVV